VGSETAAFVHNEWDFVFTASHRTSIHDGMVLMIIKSSLNLCGVDRLCNNLRNIPPCLSGARSVVLWVSVTKTF
jgi:hypothetical protein